MLNLSFPGISILAVRGVSSLLDMAQQEPSVNYLGIEIRQQLVDLANQDRDELNLKNLHYLFGSINSSAKVILEVHSREQITDNFGSVSRPLV